MVQNDGRTTFYLGTRLCLPGLNQFLHHDFITREKVDGIFKIKKLINGQIFIEKDANQNNHSPHVPLTQNKNNKDDGNKHNESIRCLLARPRYKIKKRYEERRPKKRRINPEITPKNKRKCS